MKCTDKYKKLAFNTAVFAVGSFGAKIFSLFLNNLYTGHISPAGFYSKSLAELTALFLLPVFTFSLTEAVVRYSLEAAGDKKRIFSSAALLTAGGLAAMGALMPFILGLPFLSPIRGYGGLLTLYVVMSAARSFCSQFVKALGMVRLFALDGILTTMTLFFLNVIFISRLDMGVTGFMLSVMLSDGCSALFLFAAAGLHRFFDVRAFDCGQCGVMLKFSLPLIPTTLMWTFTGFSDQIFIGNLCSGEEAGIYAAAAKLPGLISMLSSVFFQAWNISAVTENNSPDRNEFYEKVCRTYQAVLFIGGAGLILFIKPACGLLINYTTFPEYRTAYLYAPLLIAAAVFTCLDIFLAGIYTAAEHTVNSLVTVFAACGANIFLNMFLIPRLGVQGAALATFLSYYICFLIRIADVRRYVPFRFDILKNILNTLLLLLICLAVIRQWGFVYVICGASVMAAVNIKDVAAAVRMIAGSMKKPDIQ